MNDCCVKLFDDLILGCSDAHFLQTLARKLGEKAKDLSPQAKKRMIDFGFSESWPTSHDEELETTYWHAFKACSH